MFDLPAPKPGQTVLPREPDPGSMPLDPLTTAPTRRARIREDTPEPQVQPPKFPAAKVLSVGLNVLVVAVVAWGSLLGYATWRNDGHFEASMLGPSVLAKAVVGQAGMSTPLRLEDVTNGLYPTQAGRSVFYVRGQVVNRGKAELGPAQVKVEVLEGSKVVAEARGWAGLSLTPEQLYALGDAASVKALQATQKDGAVVIPPGQRRPFVVVMSDFPEDLATKGLRVGVENGAQATP